MMTKERYKQMLLDRYDADELVDVLNISAEEVIERFDDKIDDQLSTLEEDDDDEEFDG